MALQMSRRLQPVPTVKCAGCDKTQRIRAANIRPADFYACSDACADKVPRIIGTIRVVEHHACAGFYGYTDRKPTAEELRSIREKDGRRIDILNRRNERVS